MDKKYAHMLRKKLDKKIINLVKPDAMDVEEYIVNCHLQGFEPSVENGMYLHWLMTASGDNISIVQQVEDAIVNALSKKYLLDLDDDLQCSYFCDAVRDICVKDKDYATHIFEAVLKNVDEDHEVFKFCRSLNKVFGFTSVKYFNNDIENLFHNIESHI